MLAPANSYPSRRMVSSIYPGEELHGLTSDHNWNEMPEEGLNRLDKMKKTKVIYKFSYFVLKLVIMKKILFFFLFLAASKYAAAQSVYFYTHNLTAQPVTTSNLSPAFSYKIDEASVFANNTFTAPVAGVYEFTVNGLFGFTKTTTQSVYSISIESPTNNGYGRNGWTVPLNFSGNIPLGVTAICKLKQGEQVKVRVIVEGGATGSSVLSQIKFNGVKLN